MDNNHGHYSLSERTSYRKISQDSLEAAIFGFYTFPITLKSYRRLGSASAEMIVEFQSGTVIITSSFATSRLHEILRQDVRWGSE